MTANHAAGEIGVTLDDADVLFRPSLLAISSIGSPKDIIEAFVHLLDPPRTSAQAARQFRLALHVLSCCADSPDHLDELLGYYDDAMVYHPGAMPPDDIVT